MNTLIDRNGLPKSMAGPLAKAATELARVTTMSSKEAYERIVRAVGYELADWKCRQVTGGYGLGPREPIPPPASNRDELVSRIEQKKVSKNAEDNLSDHEKAVHTGFLHALEWVLDRIVVAQAREVAEPDTTPNFTRANLHEPIERALASFALMLSDLFLGKTEDTFIQIRARAVDHILNLVDYHSMSPKQRTALNGDNT